MRLVLVRTVRKKNWSLGTMIYNLINKGKIKGYRNQNGLLCYDRDEYNAYRKVNHRGRPSKNKDITNVDLRRKKTDERVRD